MGRHGCPKGSVTAEGVEKNWARTNLLGKVIADTYALMAKATGNLH